MVPDAAGDLALPPRQARRPGSVDPVRLHRRRSAAQTLNPAVLSLDALGVVGQRRRYRAAALGVVGQRRRYRAAALGVGGLPRRSRAPALGVGGLPPRSPPPALRV